MVAAGEAQRDASDGAPPSGNVTALWGRIPWGSCRQYGCEQPYTMGQLCGCWPGCSRTGICCSDYLEACGPEARPVPPVPATTRPSDGELLVFHVYRAEGDVSGVLESVNAGNLPGLMWYLQSEVFAQRRPKPGFSRIVRYKVQYKAPAALLAEGMNFGVRHAYDNEACTGPGDCAIMYARYGYFVGCNNFTSMYPYPTEPTHYAGGVWYTLPGHGACAVPTGAGDCTYTYSWPPEEVTLDELAAGDSRGFWARGKDEAANAAKVQAAAELFRRKYPDTPELQEPPCDFNFARFWH